MWGCMRFTGQHVSCSAHASPSTSLTSMIPCVQDWLICSGEQLHCGKIEGDVTRYPLKVLGVVDGLVSGPYCPPFSTMAKARGFVGPRAVVFLQVVRCISAGAKREGQWIILANVDDILRRRHK